MIKSITQVFFLNPNIPDADGLKYKADRLQYVKLANELGFIKEKL